MGDPANPAFPRGVPFLVALPFAPGTARVVVKRDAAELAARALSAHAPAVTVLSPNGGESLSGTVTVRWSASDAGGDALTYGVFYAAGGASYPPIAIGLTGTAFSW